MTDNESLMIRVASGLAEAGIPYMLVGGLAVAFHGIPRFTEDIDVTLGLDAEDIDKVLTLCERIGLSALPEDSGEFVRSTNVLPAQDLASGVRVDFLFSSLPYERSAIGRSSGISVQGTEVRVATPEDLILYKLFAGRPRDVEDARGIVTVRGETLDWEYLRKWAVEFSVVPGREGLPGAIEELEQRGLE
jgi:hypothetical protein